MKISVIIPVFNEEKRIGKCLTSLAQQSRQADEIIIVDNNCTDHTIEVARKFKKVKVILEKKQGMTPARNSGFNKAKGEILIKCDADTEFPTDWIEKIEEILTQDQKYIGVSSPVYFGDLIAARKMPWLYYVYMNIPRIVIGDYPFNGPGYAIRKSIWNKVRYNICLDDKKVHEDIDLSFHAREYGRIYFLKNTYLKSSGRRILKKPQSFFGEYILRFIKMLPSHWLAKIF